MSEYDFTVFDEKMPWTERYEHIKRAFPSVEGLDWSAVFRSDPAVMGRIINDVLKIDQAEPGRPGKRPALDVEAAEARLRGMRGEDYTILPFAEAVKRIMGDKSIRNLAFYSGLPKSTVHRLLGGNCSPSIGQIEALSKALRKDPSYFMEYRVAFVLASLAQLFGMSPESSIVQFEKLSKVVS